MQLEAEHMAKPATKPLSEGVKRTRGMSAEDVYRTLKARIIRMELAPGTVIDDVALGTQLGVSRQPIREAIIRLSGEGLVESNRNRSSIVTSFDISTLRDFLESISLLYRLTSRLAATNRRPEHLERIKVILQTHSAAIDRDDVDGVVEANRQFHLAVAEAAGNGIYLTWVRNLLDHGERIMRLYLRQYDNHVVDQAMDGHRGIVDAIAAQDAEAAEAAGALDARIMAEGLTKSFLRGGGQDFSVTPSFATIGGVT
jgi:DNA-binding GntR family transcriptional regulator